MWEKVRKGLELGDVGWRSSFPRNLWSSEFVQSKRHQTNRLVAPMEPSGGGSRGSNLESLCGGGGNTEKAQCPYLELMDGRGHALLNFKSSNA